MQAAFAEASRWDAEHQVTEHWKKLRGARSLIITAEQNYPQLRADLLRLHPDLTDERIGTLVADAQLQVVECRAHVEDALATLAASGELGAVAEQVLRNRLKLAGLAVSLFG